MTTINTIGNLIYSNGAMQVMQHDLGYTITNGERVRVVSTMPQLCVNYLNKLLGVARKLTNYEKFQHKKYGNLLLEQPAQEEEDKPRLDELELKLNNHYEQILDDYWNY